MQCPRCGIDSPSSEKFCACGHVFSAPIAAPTMVSSLERLPDVDVSLPAAEMQGCRKCARCGSAMIHSRCERMFINGLIPSGKRYYYECVGCAKEIKTRSIWRLFLVFIGCLMFAFIFWVLYPFEKISYLIFALLLAVYPLTLLSELLVRIRYRTIRTKDSSTHLS